MLRVVLLLCACAAAAAVNLEHLRAKSKRAKLQYPVRDDPNEDAKLTVPELVRKYGYPLEEHQVVTHDGYILTMHHIPHGKKLDKKSNTDRPVVFLMHGLMSSSAAWVLLGPGNGLAYILAEEGFDVWMGNARGSRYSRAHISLHPDGNNTGFWHFSWDEIGNIDLPAMIDYALNKTGQQRLHYIGHSQGTTVFFVMCSLRADYNKKIISMNALAPVVYMTNSGSALIRAISQFTNILGGLLEMIGVDEFIPNPKIKSLAGEKLCRDRAVKKEICSDIMFLLENTAHLNVTIPPINFGHEPQGASIRQFAHYGQNMRDKDFRRFDHGRRKNKKVYGTLKAPRYDLSKVQAPVYLHYSLADDLAHVKDVERLWKEIGNPVEKYKVPMSSFAHSDFIRRIDAKPLVYAKVIDIMKRYKTKMRLHGKKKLWKIYVVHIKKKNTTY